MACKYSYYKSEENYMPRLYCSIDDKYCIYSKKCLKESKFIALDNQEECYKMIMEEKKNIPNGAYFVQTYRPNKNGQLYLYVIINDSVNRIQSNLTALNQNYVYLKETLDGYEVSLEPFVEKKKVTTTKTKR